MVNGIELYAQNHFVTPAGKMTLIRLFLLKKDISKLFNELGHINAKI